jgi:cell division protein FtsW
MGGAKNSYAGLVDRDYVGYIWTVARSAVVLTYLVFGLTVFGLIMVGNASVVDAVRDFGDKWYYLKLQAVWLVLGSIVFIIASKYPYKKLEKIAPTAMLVAVILLILVLIPGIGNRLLGARRWISLGVFSLQPAELVKLTMAMYLASLLKKPKEKFSAFLIAIGGVAGLVMLEPDLGTTIVVVGMSFLTFFGSGGKIKSLLATIPLGALAIVGLILVSPYRLDRLKTFMDHSQDPLGSSYHIQQVLLSLGSGGIFGEGIGQSRQKYEFLPEVTTDSIFAVIAEELGFIGGVAVLGVFLLLISTGMKVARNTEDKFGSNLALAITCWIGLQALINISAMVALVPLTGIPLPFISYGGSALVVNLVGMGILVNIAKQNE